MKGTARQINALVAELRSLLKKANATAWERDTGKIDRVEEMYVAYLVATATEPWEPTGDKIFV
jgi:hypothetical protein